MKCTTIPTSFVYGNIEEYKKVVGKYCELGIDTIRVNCTRYNQERYIKHIEDLRKSYEFYGKHVRILLDLPFPGEKVRIEFGGDKAYFNFMEGESYEFVKDREKIDGVKTLMFDKENLYDEVSVDERIILGDGDIELLVLDKNETRILTKSLNSGSIAYRKAAYTKDIFFSKNCSSEKNEEIYEFIHNCNPSYVVFSFLESPEDISIIIEKIANWSKRPKLFAKIETLGGVKNINSIISNMDGIMIGRGDLGLSCDCAEFVAACEKLYKICQKEKTEVIAATDILNSLGNSNVSIPNRAEMMDVHYMHQFGITQFVANSKISDDLQQIEKFDKILQNIACANKIMI